MSDVGYSIGWWIESADEETYGPASRATLQQLLQEGVISRNTLVRHCTQEAARPVVDQPGILNGTPLPESAPMTGDRLAEYWPRRKREQLQLAEAELPCAWHNRPAVGVCLRCHAPYCRKCQMKPYKKSYYFCKRCQSSLHNRRVLAFILDGWLLYLVAAILMIPAIALIVSSGQSEQMPTAAAILYNLAWFAATILYAFRDPLLGGAGPGKRIAGLRVVCSSDGVTPLGYGQGLIRFIPLMIPFVVIIEAYLAYRDPLMRRLGDRWAGTRVIDTPKKLAKARAKVRLRLAKKGSEPVVPEEADATLEQYARIGG